MPTYPQTPERTPDPKDLQEHHAPELERRLLVRGLKRMIAGRVACSRCRRAPLVGERLHVFAPGRGEESVCELCLKGASEDSLGRLVRTERVHAAERPLNVQRAV